MRDKKAMSEIVTTVIMVVLALVAVAVIWTIINNLISEKGAQVVTTSKCTDVTLTVESVSNCVAAGCDVRVRRGPRGDAIDGVKVVLKSATGASDVDTIEGNIPPLQTATLAVDSGTFDATTANKVEVTAYFLDDSGIEQNCMSPAVYNF